MTGVCPLDDAFLERFKVLTEQRWTTTSIDPRIYGFQFITGTRWNPGLDTSHVSEYEEALGVRFPDDFRFLLTRLNGTIPATVNIYGGACPPVQSIGVYSYPIDLAVVRARIADLDLTAAKECVAEYGITSGVKFVPIYAHRYVVCTDDPSSCMVISAMDSDVIVYGHTLADYLTNEFLK